MRISIAKLRLIRCSLRNQLQLPLILSSQEKALLIISLMKNLNYTNLKLTMIAVRVMDIIVTPTAKYRPSKYLGAD